MPPGSGSARPSSRPIGRPHVRRPRPHCHPAHERRLQPPAIVPFRSSAYGCTSAPVRQRRHDEHRVPGQIPTRQIHRPARPVVPRVHPVGEQRGVAVSAATIVLQPAASMPTGQYTSAFCASARSGSENEPAAAAKVASRRVRIRDMESSRSVMRIGSDGSRSGRDGLFARVGDDRVQRQLLRLQLVGHGLGGLSACRSCTTRSCRRYAPHTLDSPLALPAAENVGRTPSPAPPSSSGAPSAGCRRTRPTRATRAPAPPATRTRGSWTHSSCGRAEAPRAIGRHGRHGPHGRERP